MILPDIYNELIHHNLVNVERLTLCMKRVLVRSAPAPINFPTSFYEKLILTEDLLMIINIFSQLQFVCLI